VTLPEPPNWKEVEEACRKLLEKKGTANAKASLRILGRLLMPQYHIDTLLTQAPRSRARP
jgi:hypothetical protein